ncbi:PaaI family thioesterase [Candidatus Contendibacter odensensis]|uniref:Thioesterase superfamily protein n=1 Tax=Candidatus Contendobacter odensis Run_B_J11 TaxID=1400861 RepID=A0A7U7J3G0_9GAMM|nr:PaaI family thioesterase [Candidatus Contendobacter odensis]CDH46114.1 Thioesterase superfamily protein [Candidatus Contendobacter odensis Run_B_J11]
MNSLRSDITVEVLNERGSDYLPGYLGIVILDLAPQRLICRMEVKKLHIAPNYFLHAASVVALADTACGYATFAHLPEGAESFTTLELKSNFLGTVQEGGSVGCLATAQHLGRTTQVWDAVVTDETTGRKLALFRCTQMILWKKTKGIS